MIDSAPIFEFLQTNFDKRIASVSPIGSGWFSQAFGFTVDRRAFVFRVNTFEEDFQKDAFAYQHFSAPDLPIPRIVLLGRFDQTRHFAITERCNGQTLDEIDDMAVRNVVPQLFEILDVLHSVEISGYRDWGLTDATGHGLFPSWGEYLLSLYDQKFAYQWPDLAQHTFLEGEMYASLLEAMRQLLPYCSAEKYLIHRDFGFDNVLSDGQRITGVLDWADCGLGDFVYDIAYLDFWSKNISYGVLWQEYAASHGRDVPHFEERMRCYMLHMGLDSMAVAALKGNEKSYVRIRERTRSVFQPGRRSASDWTQ